jgi:hypothetical protein
MRLVTRHAGSLTCVVTGEAMIVVAVAQDNARDGFAIALATLGTALVVIGAALPRLREAEVSGTGVKISLAERERTGKLSTDAEADAVESEGEPPGRDETRDISRSLLAWRALADLLRPQEGPLAGCRLRLYLYDADTDSLDPVQLPGDESEIDSWPVGHGAVGTAYARGEYVLVEGAATSDATYGLTPEQQARYRALHAVAAMPVTSAAGEAIAVLSVASTDPAPRIGSPEGFDEHLLLSELVARVLIDVLRWFDDG